ncbi:uncharacterized protein AKAW2_31431S [Aspergillus luchuensis]|uniref:Uncharacterized protein n=5 Tax=Aspergillus subgen. Circumdati TaxID=2720871 RepID=A0A317VIH6_ASPEC|nr:uncharacterized protein BO83DRAFT_437210 [Aspergillus eucalypticola CBS 122712]XP_041541878.1 uncharacterized protein AKAW2_31431S [Aspergillus luchuensis]OJZ83678.1 hypothetical protein ASPFODRAFT_209416 [Aspergillus luchuensis CBS 106.47]GAA83179.1 similar to An18g01250 [Aspergillus luchuensis IFO 4308]GAQ46268.1 similar to An18g01250 [Aspergillus niger]GLA80667.1 hypothetical protein AtubIFM56815_001495 [Aspergillus tubingensis]PWY74176.1 hypothetical protein BO83DRAFT_437210 [Aspergill
MPNPSLSYGNGMSSGAKSRNTAFLTMFAVISGALLTFRMQSPRKEQRYSPEGDQQAIDGENKLGRSMFVSDGDREAVRGGKPGEPKVGRAPHEGLGGR